MNIYSLMLIFVGFVIFNTKITTSVILNIIFFQAYIESLIKHILKTFTTFIKALVIFFIEYENINYKLQIFITIIKTLWYKY